MVKNYKELCRLLEISIKNGKSKVCQIKEFERFVKYHKEGNKFIIDEIYDEPLEKSYGRGKNPNSHGNKNFSYYNNLKVPRQHWNSVGVYIITLKNCVYIGSTVKGFRDRFMRHRQDSDLPSHYMLEKDGIFEILQLCNGMSEPEIRKIENEWIQYYKNQREWKVVNQNPAWSLTKKTKKQKFKSIKIDSRYYEDAIGLLVENGFEDKLKIKE